MVVFSRQSIAAREQSMEPLWQELRYALRSLQKSPGFTAVAVLTLALGIGANTAIFSIVQGVLLRPLPFTHPQNLVQIWNTYSLLPAFPQVELSPGDFHDFRREAASFSEMAAYVSIPQGFNLTGQGEAERVEARYANSGFFPLLGVRPVAGRGFAPEEDAAGATRSVMITHRLWQSHFGSKSIRRGPHASARWAKLHRRGRAACEIWARALDGPLASRRSVPR
jgi:hypothetical protein